MNKLTIYLDNIDPEAKTIDLEVVVRDDENSVNSLGSVVPMKYHEILELITQLERIALTSLAAEKAWAQEFSTGFLGGTQSNKAEKIVKSVRSILVSNLSEEAKKEPKEEQP